MWESRVCASGVSVCMHMHVCTCVSGCVCVCVCLCVSACVCVGMHYAPGPWRDRETRQRTSYSFGTRSMALLSRIHLHLERKRKEQRRSLVSYPPSLPSLSLSHSHCTSPLPVHLSTSLVSLFVSLCLFLSLLVPSLTLEPLQASPAPLQVEQEST